MWAAEMALLANDRVKEEYNRLTVNAGRSMAEEVASGAGTSTSSASTWPIRPADETKADVRAALKRMMTNSYLETSGGGRDKFRKTPSGYGKDDSSDDNTRGRKFWRWAGAGGSGL